jgi:uncharacterized protein
MTQFAIQRVRATPEAVELLDGLFERHGPVALVQFGRCSDGAAVKCLTRAEVLPGDDDIKLGEIGGAPFYVDAHEYDRSGRPTVTVDVAAGSAGSFALEGLEELHLVTHASDADRVREPA